jgi:diaminopimelate decarboxylase
VSVFHVCDGRLWAESAPLDVIAQRFGTPCYVYSRAAIENAYREYTDALTRRDAIVCYAVKANSNLAVLDVLAQLGAGFDIVSGGELARVIAAGGDPAKTVFSGVGKSDREMLAALDAGVMCFNIESESELTRLDRIAAKVGKRAPISVRVNPDVDPRTHPYIATGLKESKFGVPYDESMRLYEMAASLAHIAISGIGCHIGSQLADLAPFEAAIAKLLEQYDALAARGVQLQHIDVGGGLGIRYHEETPPRIGDYVESLLSLVQDRPARVLLEPGRSLVGTAGVLLTRVEVLKHGAERNFAVVDAAMNDLIRPALYDAWHDMVPVGPRAGPARTYEVVGPVCETGDFLGRARKLRLEEGDLLAILSAGAYGMSMASNYNTRPRAAEVMVDGAAMHLIRERESIPTLFALERRAPRGSA